MTKTIKKPLVSLIIIFVLSVVVDQATKQWAYQTLLDDRFHEQADNFPVCSNEAVDQSRSRFIHRHQKNITVIDGSFDFRYVENCASAFGMMSKVPESFRFPFFLVISILAAAFIPYLYKRTPANQTFMLYALPFVLGGAVGNLIDRLVYRFVIDFIDWYILFDGLNRHWPTFNIADVAIVIGIGLMILQMLPMHKNTPSSDMEDNKTS